MLTEFLFYVCSMTLTVVVFWLGYKTGRFMESVKNET